MGYIEIKILKDDWETVEKKLSFYGEITGRDPLDDNVYIVSLPIHLIDFDKISRVNVGKEYIEIQFQGYLHDFPDIEVCGEANIMIDDSESYHYQFATILKEVLNL